MNSAPRFVPVTIWLLAMCAGGCGTTRSSDTGRTATEQLLISGAIDQAVQSVNFTPLAGERVYLDARRLKGVVDEQYLTSTLRQHVLASGCVLADNREEAEYILEARAGAVGTDSHDLLFGIPAMNVPQIVPMQPIPAAIPEVPIAKRRDQRGIAKIAVFAYHRETGVPVWQSGVSSETASSNDVWVLGAGPFRHGTIDNGPTFVGTIPKLDSEPDQAIAAGNVAGVEDEAVFTTPAQIAARLNQQRSADSPDADEGDPAVLPASHTVPASPPASSEPRPFAAPPDAKRLPLPLD